MNTDTTKTVEKKSPFQYRIQVGDGGLDAQGLKRMAEADPVAFMRKVNDRVDSGEFRWSKVRSLGRLFNALADVEVPVRIPAFEGETREVKASAFPLLSGALTVAGINDAYLAVPTIGQDLVTEVDDAKRVSEFAEITSLKPDKDRTEEGDPFPEIGAGETKFEVRHKRSGYRISITKETIEENDIAGIVGKCDALGEIAGEEIEEQTLKRVTDHDGSAASPAEPYALRLNGTATQLYNATANNPGTQAPSGTRVNSNALQDETDLDNALAVLAAMKNTRGKRVSLPVAQMQFVVPFAKSGTALKILGSELAPGMENELNNWGPRGERRPQFVSSPKLDDLSANTWYLGNFKKQFVRKWKFRVEYVTLAGNTQEFLTRRIAFQARIAWDCEVGARSYIYVVQNLAATTAPKDGG